MPNLPQNEHPDPRMELHHNAAAVSAELPTTAQRLYIRYYVAITADLLVLGLLSQFWDRVTIADFSTGLFAAILLQLLLQMTLIVEHSTAKPFEGKTGAGWKVGRFVTAWFILFSSKFVMLWAIGLLLGDSIQFHGAMHGALAFIGAVVAMILAEEVVFRVYRWLENSAEKTVA